MLDSYAVQVSSGVRDLAMELTISSMTRRFASEQFAIITYLLYSFPPTPAVLASPYTEPLFAMFTFIGFDLALRRRHIFSAVSLAMAAGIRATGVLGAAVVCWSIMFPGGIPSRADFRITVSQLHP